MTVDEKFNIISKYIYDHPDCTYREIEMYTGINLKTAQRIVKSFRLVKKDRRFKDDRSK